jgi:hypothetical protein
MAASLPCMQWLVVPTPRLPPWSLDTMISVVPACQPRRLPGWVTNSHASWGGAHVSAVRSCRGRPGRWPWHRCSGSTCTRPAATVASWEDSVAWLHDRVTFPEGEHPTAYQEELLGAIATHKRASGRGSHGLGKTAIGAWALLWFADTRDKARADWKAMRALEDAGPWDVPAHQAPAPGRPWAAPITHAHEENADCQRRTWSDVYPRCASPTSGMATGRNRHGRRRSHRD